MTVEMAATEPLEPMTTPTKALTRRTMSAIEVQVLWEGEPEFVVDVRLVNPEPGTWVRYGRVQFPRDPDGVWRLRFTADRFIQLAERWLTHEFDEARAQRKLTAALLEG